MPSARVAMAVKEKDGERRKARSVMRMSWNTLSFRGAPGSMASLLGTERRAYALGSRAISWRSPIGIGSAGIGAMVEQQTNDFELFGDGSGGAARARRLSR